MNPPSESSWPNQPAEAATELGADTDEDDGFAAFFIPLAAAIIGCLTLIIWAVIHAK
jgi:hypothetical protein